MKANIFSQLIAEFPELNGLSAQKFSKLTRLEMYQVAKAIRGKYPDIKKNGLHRYNNLNTSALAAALYGECTTLYPKK